MRFSADWQDDAPNAAPEDAATVAEFKLFVADRNVTQHVLQRRFSDVITIPLYAIAESVAYGWWDVFGGRTRPYRLNDHCSGLQLPDIALSFDGVLFRLAVSPFDRNADERNTLRYITVAEEILDRSSAEDQLQHFVDAVLARLRRKGVPETNADARWKRVLGSRADPEEAAFCEASGALGRDPYRIDDADALLIEQSAALFSGETLLEFLSGISSRASGAPGAAELQWIETVEKRPPTTSSVPGLKHVEDRSVPGTPTLKAWALGYRRARMLRRDLHLSAADRIRTVAELAGRLDASRKFETAPRVYGLRALRNDLRDEMHVHLRETGREEQNLFGFARACGDVVCFPEPSRSVVNDLQSAYRQAAGRAFAAEFLAPIDELRSMEADGYDRSEMAAEFGVWPDVIDRQFENAPRIDEACATL